MQAFRIAPKIHIFDTFKEFADEFKIGKNDLVLTRVKILRKSANK